MSDVMIRVLIVVVVVGVAMLTIFGLRRRSLTAHRTFKATGLDPGVYFFSSSACADCEPARAALASRYGESGFVEYKWETDRDTLDSLRIDRVPTTLVVDDSGVGSLWAGVPGSMFSPVDP